MRTAATNGALEASISSDRLRKYLTAAGGELDAALAIYERNMRLSEAFSSPLQCMEICFRNRMCVNLQASYGADGPTNNQPPFAADATDNIRQVIFDFRGGAPTVGDIVAGLHFGFWVGLIGPRYDNTLWRRALHRAFRAGGNRKRTLVHGRFNALRRFRNRVAHHEPIFDRNVLQVHDEIMEAIGWMCAETPSWAVHHSRLPEVVAT